MRKITTYLIKGAGVAAAMWVAWPALLYCGIFARFGSPRSIAVFPGAAIGACAICAGAFLRRSTLLTAWAIPSALAMVAVATAGRLHDFTAYGESGPGPWEWINSLSLSGSVILLMMVTTKFIFSKSNQPNKNHGGSHHQP